MRNFRLTIKKKLIIGISLLILSSIGAFIFYNTGVSYGGWTIQNTSSSKIESILKHREPIYFLTNTKNVSKAITLLKGYNLQKIGYQRKNNKILLTYNAIIPNSNYAYHLYSNLKNKLKNTATITGIPIIQASEIKQIQQQTNIYGILAIIAVLIITPLIMSGAIASMISFSSGIFSLILSLGIFETLNISGIKISFLGITTITVISLALGFDYPLILITRLRSTNNIKDTLNKYFKNVVIYSLLSIFLLSLSMILVKELILQSMILGVLVSAISTLIVIYLWTNPAIIIFKEKIYNKKILKRTIFRVHKLINPIFSIIILLLLLIPIFNISNNIKLSIPLFNKSEISGNSVISTTNTILNNFGKEISMFPIIISNLNKNEFSTLYNKNNNIVINANTIEIPSNILPLNQTHIIKRLKKNFPNTIIGGSGAGVEQFNNSINENMKTVIIFTIIIFLLIMFIYCMRFLKINIIKSIIASIMILFVSIVSITSGLSLSMIKSILTGYNIYNIVDPTIVILVGFGLSIDYTIVTIKSIKEKGYSNGIAYSSPIIRGAGIIMITVFIIFSFSQDAAIWQMTFPLALIVFIDAFILRPYVLAPALKLLKIFHK